MLGRLTFPGKLAKILKIARLILGNFTNHHAVAIDVPLKMRQVQRGPAIADHRPEVGVRGRGANDNIALGLQAKARLFAVKGLEIDDEIIEGLAEISLFQRNASDLRVRNPRNMALIQQRGQEHGRDSIGEGKAGAARKLCGLLRVLHHAHLVVAVHVVRI